MRGFALVIALAIVSCGKNEKPPRKLEGSSSQESGPRNPTGGGPNGDAAAEAKQLFFTVCAQCHGHDGTGMGPAAESLNPKPRNYTDAAWQKTVSDDDIKKIILEGGQAIGKSAMMPANPNLVERPEVVSELVKIIRGFGQGTTAPSK